MNFLTVLESGSPRSECHQGQVLVRAFLLACRWLSSCCFLTQPFFSECAGGERDFSLSSFYKTTNSTGLAPYSCDLIFNLNYFLKTPSPNTATVGLEPQHMNFGGHSSVHSRHIHRSLQCTNRGKHGVLWSTSRKKQYKQGLASPDASPKESAWASNEILAN